MIAFLILIYLAVVIISIILVLHKKTKEPEISDKLKEIIKIMHSPLPPDALPFASGFAKSISHKKKENK